MTNPPLKEVVHISRHWDNPEIRVALHREGIVIEVGLEEFCRAVVAEIPHPAMTMTRAKLEANVLAALEVVLGKVKEASAHV